MTKVLTLDPNRNEGRTCGRCRADLSAPGSRMDHVCPVLGFHARRFVDSVNLCLAALRQGDMFLVGESYDQACNVAFTDLHEKERELGFKLLHSLRAVCEEHRAARRACTFCLQVLDKHERGHCDECAIVVFTELLGSRGWVRSATKKSLEHVRAERRLAVRRVDKKYSFLKRTPSAGKEEP